MTDDSRRRRLAARGAVAAAVLALPMTASICYSEAIAAPPEPPTAPFAPEAPVAPLAPEAPEVPDFEGEFSGMEREFDRAEEDLARAEREAERAERRIRVIERDREKMGRARSRMVWNGKDWDAMSAEERRELKEEMRELREQFAEGGEFQREMENLRHELADENGELQREMRAAMAEARAGMAEAHAAARAHARSVRVSCDNKDIRQEFESSGGKTTVICDTRIHASVVSGLRQARAEIAADATLSSDIKAEILSSMDKEIAKHQR